MLRLKQRRVINYVESVVAGEDDEGEGEGGEAGLAEARHHHPQHYEHGRLGAYGYE